MTIHARYINTSINRARKGANIIHEKKREDARLFTSSVEEIGRIFSDSNQIETVHWLAGWTINNPIFAKISFRNNVSPVSNFTVAVHRELAIGNQRDARDHILRPHEMIVPFLTRVFS
jgi:hypothetical protein